MGGAAAQDDGGLERTAPPRNRRGVRAAVCPASSLVRTLAFFRLRSPPRPRFATPRGDPRTARARAGLVRLKGSVPPRPLTIFAALPAVHAALEDERRRG
jgi:hypothetical protein